MRYKISKLLIVACLPRLCSGTSVSSHETLLHPNIQANSASGVNESGRRISLLHGYRQNVTNLTIGSTPYEQQREDATEYPTCRVRFEIDSSGRFSNREIVKSCGSLARDFWTIYAVAACPPIKPWNGIATPLKIEISNILVPANVTSQEGEDWQIALSRNIPRYKNAKNIFFPLIPASFIRCFPKSVTLNDITARENLVGIPIKSLCADGQSNWNVKSCNALLNSKTEMSEFLSEWSNFFAKNNAPSKDELTKFATQLKVKYKNLLVTEGEPEAPLP